MTVMTLTTDFGLADGYVGVLKGVILGITPGATIVDISHDIPVQDIAAGAYVLEQAYRYFPPHTVHLAVVDPGVGSTRRPLLLTTPQACFVGPDNGLFSFLLDAPAALQAYQLDVPTYWLPQVSSTFHGRDIFAPSAAHLARGVPPGLLGQPVPLASLVRLPAAPPTVAGDQVAGRIVYIDRFGNLITNIPAGLLPPLPPGTGLIVQIGTHQVPGLHPTYSAVPPGQPVALIGSAGRLEIGVREGHAARELGGRVGDAVVCRAAPGFAILDKSPGNGV